MNPIPVSLTFDDALDCHLDSAVPILEQHGVRGTFYVNIGSPAFTARHREWADAAGRGHELGNHSIFHPGVASKLWVTEGIALERYTLDRMRQELAVANRILGMLDGRSERSFAFPCSNPMLGSPGWSRRTLARLGLDRTRIMGWVDRSGLDVGSSKVDYTPVVRELFPMARCGGIDPDQLPRVPRDWHRVRAIAGDGLDVDTLAAAVDSAIARQAWATFVFHGIGGGHALQVAAETLDAFVAHLVSDPRVIVMPFLQAGRSAARG